MKPPRPPRIVQQSQTNTTGIVNEKDDIVNETDDTTITNGRNKNGHGQRPAKPRPRSLSLSMKPRSLQFLTRSLRIRGLPLHGPEVPFGILLIQRSPSCWDGNKNFVNPPSLTVNIAFIDTIPKKACPSFSVSPSPVRLLSELLWCDRKSDATLLFTPRKFGRGRGFHEFLTHEKETQRANHARQQTFENLLVGWSVDRSVGRWGRSERRAWRSPFVFGNSNTSCCGTYTMWCTLPRKVAFIFLPRRVTGKK